MTDYSELKRLAEAATQCSGPRRVETDYNGVHQVVGDGSWKILNAWHTPDGKGLENAQFTAAASPAAVLALIDENEALRKDAELGRVATMYIDRLCDPAECDPLERIVEEYVGAFSAAMSKGEQP